ncbi:MAG: hypothetical protein LBT89_03730 [Planctomycetaceae bacterium]|jgi:hypothetical protein|nr:hypothetical protein [Planctomycetaceae bacterium]
MRLICTVLAVFAAFGGDNLRLSGEETKISNGTLAVIWNPDTHTVTLDQDGIFASIKIPEGNAFSIVKHPISGRDGKMADASSLVIQHGDIIDAVFTAAEDNPFVIVTKHLNKELFAGGSLKNLAFPKFELTLEADKIKTLGTAGLRAADGHKGSYMFLAAANPADRSGVVAGWITSSRGSGIVFSGKENGKVVISPVIEYGKLLPPADSENSAENISEVFVIGKFDDCRRGLERYARQIARSNQIKIKEPIAGYCTWYSNKFGGACNEKEIVNLTKAAAEKLAPFGFSFVQIDDTWQDGISKNGPRRNFLQVKADGPYPNGMKPTAEMIKSHHFKAGIWLIPFAGSADDPIWDKSLFVKSGVTDEVNDKGKPTRPNKIWANKKDEPYQARWSGTTLDMTNPAAQEYLRKEIEQMAKDWGYNYFKLDGFHVSMACENTYVNNEYKADDFGEAVYSDPSITPVAAHRLGSRIIRQAAGDDAFLLGCCVSQNMRSMGASFGCVDAMRVGPDNGSGWNSLKSGPRCGSNRYFLNGRVWWNDPDPVYVRDNMPLEHARLITSWVAVSGQLYAFSDWLPTLSEERVEILRRTIRPHGLRSARPVDLFNEDLPKIWYLTNKSTNRVPQTERHIVAFYNWDDKKPEKIEVTPNWAGLPKAKEYVAFDFWGNKLFGTFTDKISVELPPGSCLVLAVRPVEEHPVLLSTSQHITQGIVDAVEEKWNSETKTLSGVSKVIAGDDYELRIYDPAKKEIRRELLKPTETSDAFKWSVKIE